MNSMSQPYEAVLIGAGNRGADVYGSWIREHPEQMRLTAVAEPLASRREKVALLHQIPPDMQYASWETLLEKPKLADVAIIATQDQMHTSPALAALNAGYDVLLEKPMAHRLDECIALTQAAEDSGGLLQIAHVLRYTSFFQQVHTIVQAGRLGQVVTVSHRENVSAEHMAHSYVRGNWRSEAESSPMILAKSCHDLDILYWILDRKVRRLSSFGTLRHYRAENAPPGATKYCLDGCPAANTCPYYAPEFYIELKPIKHALANARNPLVRLGGRLALHAPWLLRALAVAVPPVRQLTEYEGWPRSVISETPADEKSLYQALQSGPYGRCVYHCNNDVVDHQVVAMEFEDGLSATFTMHGHSHEEGRTIRIDGSHATLLGKFSWNETFIEIHDHRTLKMERIDMPNGIESGGHGGGDDALMQAFVRALDDRQQTPLTSARASLESHLLAFAAEQARIEGTVIDMKVFREKAERLNEQP